MSAGMIFELENWQGLQSVPRVLQLQSFGATKTAIAKRFQISRPTLDAALKRYQELLTEKPADEATGKEATDASRRNEIIPSP